MKSYLVPQIICVVAATLFFESAHCFSSTIATGRRMNTNNKRMVFLLQSSSSSAAAAEDTTAVAAANANDEEEEEEEEEEIVDYDIPEDAVINIKPKAMKRLRELREKQKTDSLVLRMGVRNGGCSGLSYIMDFATEDDVQEDDAIDEYPGEKLKCVVDAKSMLYLYGLELDFSEELIGGGFKFFNPNAEDSCGCGSSFGV
jgi:iron-sulfur cluster assembly accessory protein